MKFLVDMNMSPLWVPFFIGAGFEAIHWSTVGRVSAKDSEIVAFAITHGWIILTHDLDFGMLLAASKAGCPSVIQVRTQDVLPPAIGDLVLRAIRAAAPYFSDGALVTVEPLRHRIRLLPI